MRTVLVGQEGIDRYNTLHRLAVAWVYADLDSATVYERRAMTIAREMDHGVALGISTMMFGNIAYFRGDLDETVRYYDQALALQREAGNTAQVSALLNNIGNVHEERRDFPAALDAWLQSLDLAESVQDTAKVSKALSNIGELYASMGQHAEALRYQRRALTLKRSQLGRYTDALGLLMLSYVAIAESERALGRTDEALRTLRRALREAPPDASDFRVAHVRTQLARTLRLAGRADEALEPAERAVRTLRAYGSPSHLADGLIEQAEVLVALRRFGAAEPVAREAVRLIDEPGDEGRVVARAVLSQALAGLNEVEEAFAVQSQALALQDSLNEVENAEIVAAVQAEYDVGRAERRTEFQTQRAEIAELRMDRQWMWLAAGAGAVALLMALAGALWRTARLRRRANALLEDKNVVVGVALARTERLLDEREVLLREVHHRVKNNLQIVASLVNLQSETVHDPAALAALRQMRSRVEALALVHRRLYSDDDLRAVDAPDYLGELAALLESSYAWAASDVAVEADVADVALDADTAVPLGLAAAELVANAFEHAFPAGDSGADGLGKGRIRLALDVPDAGRLRLVVEDSGTGLPPGLDAPPSDSLGLQLAADLALQLGGRFEMGPSERMGGARFALDFPAPELRDEGPASGSTAVSGDGTAGLVPQTAVA